MTKEKLEKAFEIQDEIKRIDSAIERLKDDATELGVDDGPYVRNPLPFQSGLKLVCSDFLGMERARLQAEFDAL